MGVLFAGVEPVGVNVVAVGVIVVAVGVNVVAVGVIVVAVEVIVGAVEVIVVAVGVDVGGSCSREMAVGLNEVAPFSKLLDLGILDCTGFTI